jgi:hypothetical protein
MSWRVTWCDESSGDDHPIQGRDAPLADDVVDLIKEILQGQASDISITKRAPARDLGGVPFPEMIKALEKREVVPFLGAGVPFSARPAGVEWHKGAQFLPSGAELARYLAFLSNLPIWNIRDADNLARVASYYTITNPGADLADELRTIFDAGKPTVVHEMFAEPILHPMLLVTTNYDTLMEQALDARGIKYDTVIHCTDIGHRGSVMVKRHGTEQSEYITPTDFYADLKTTTVLYKMHGSISRSGTSPQTGASVNFVITEEDYVAFLSKLSSAPPVVPPLFRSHFQRSSFLFLGYSLEDWNVRVILDSLNDVMSDDPSGARRPRGGDKMAPTSTDEAYGDPLAPPPSRVAEALALESSRGGGNIPRRRHWAIQYQPTSYDIEVWKGRGVVIRNMDLSDFVVQIRNPNRGLFAKP